MPAMDNEQEVMSVSEQSTDKKLMNTYKKSKEGPKDSITTYNGVGEEPSLTSSWGR